MRDVTREHFEAIITSVNSVCNVPYDMKHSLGNTTIHTLDLDAMIFVPSKLSNTSGLSSSIYYSCFYDLHISVNFISTANIC